MKGELLSVLKRLISPLNEPIFIFSSDGKIEYMSEKVGSMFGISSISDSFYSYFKPQDQKKLKDSLNDLGVHFLDFESKMIFGQTTIFVKMRMVSWKENDGDTLFLCSLKRADNIELKRRDTLRKTLVVEQLSRSSKIRSGKLYDAIYEILQSCSIAMRISRVNAWLTSHDNLNIDCIGNFEQKSFSLEPQDRLNKQLIPSYLNSFEKEKILLFEDALNDKRMVDLKLIYLIPNDIRSTMDVPIRIDGLVVGVICFEQVKQKRVFSLEDQKFALMASQLVSLAVESHERKLELQRIEKKANEAQKNLYEAEERISNNLKLINQLLETQLARCKDDYHRDIIKETQVRIYTLMLLHDLMRNSTTNGRVLIENYARSIAQEIQEKFKVENKEIQLIQNYDSCEISPKKAIYLGIILNEALTNSYRHGFKNVSNGAIRIDFRRQENFGVLEVRDTGGAEKGDVKKRYGFEIMQLMADLLNANLEDTYAGGISLKLKFKLA